MSESVGVLDIPQSDSVAIPKVDGVQPKSIINQHLMDFGARLGDDQVRKQVFADLVGANLRGSVVKWFQGLYDPTGIYEIKARIILECLGYQFPEHRRMHPDIHTFAKHVGLNLCDYEHAAQMLDVNRDTMLRILSGRNNTSNSRVAIVSTYIQDHTNDLVGAIDNVLTLLSVQTVPIVTQPQETTIGVETSSDNECIEPIRDCGFNPGQVKDMAVGLVKALGPIAKLLASDTFSALDREEVRTMVGRYAIFDLKNDLIKLCGERARTTTTTEDK